MLPGEKRPLIYSDDEIDGEHYELLFRYSLPRCSLNCGLSACFD